MKGMHIGDLSSVNDGAMFFILAFYIFSNGQVVLLNLYK